jgi:hypothetical protein
VSGFGIVTGEGSGPGTVVVTDAAAAGRGNPCRTTSASMASATSSPNAAIVLAGSDGAAIVCDAQGQRRSSDLQSGLRR